MPFHIFRMPFLEMQFHISELLEGCVCAFERTGPAVSMENRLVLEPRPAGGVEIFRRWAIIKSADVWVEVCEYMAPLPPRN